ncbi:MAG: response regulator [Phycisphaeraceae bacterium]
MFPKTARQVTILMADDDAEDRLLTQQALRRHHLADDVRFVTDGQELMEYLHREGAYAAPADAPRPGLILLDLNMPRKDGRAALREIKGDARLRHIPVLVMTSSSREGDVLRSYQLGVSSFITKPASFDALVDAMQVIGRYWLEIVELPDEETGDE